MGKQSWSEEEALQALREGRERGLDHYFGLYYAPLTYFAFKLLEDQYLAEEIASEAFIKLWCHREQLSEEGSIKAWLYSTVRNAAIDHLRKAKRLRVSEAGLQTPETVERSVLLRMIDTETISQVIRTLETLPPKCRQVFQKFYFQGKTHEEIARELNLSPHTVRNQRIRAVRLLKEKITLLALAFALLAFTG